MPRLEHLQLSADIDSADTAIDNSFSVVTGRRPVVLLPITFLRELPFPRGGNSDVLVRLPSIRWHWTRNQMYCIWSMD